MWDDFFTSAFFLPKRLMKSIPQVAGTDRSAGAEQRPWGKYRNIYFYFPLHQGWMLDFLYWWCLFLMGVTALSSSIRLKCFEFFALCWVWISQFCISRKPCLFTADVLVPKLCIHSLLLPKLGKILYSCVSLASRKHKNFPHKSVSYSCQQVHYTVGWNV